MFKTKKQCQYLNQHDFENIDVKLLNFIKESIFLNKEIILKYNHHKFNLYFKDIITDIILHCKITKYIYENHGVGTMSSRIDRVIHLIDLQILEINTNIIENN